jgi:hypothetical protein
MQFGKAALVLFSLLALVNVDAENVREKAIGTKKKSAKSRGIRGYKERALQSENAAKGVKATDDETENDDKEEKGGKDESEGGSEDMANDRQTQVPTTTNDLQEGDSGIVGGSDAKDGEFPFYVKFEGSTLCGGK